MSENPQKTQGIVLCLSNTPEKLLPLSLRSYMPILCFMLQWNWVEEKNSIPLTHLFWAQILLHTHFDILAAKKIIYSSNLCKFLSLRGQLVSQSLCLLIPALLCGISRLVSAEERKEGMGHCWNKTAWVACLAGAFRFGIRMDFPPLAGGRVLSSACWTGTRNFLLLWSGNATYQIPRGLENDALHFLSPPVVCQSWILGGFGDLWEHLEGITSQLSYFPGCLMCGWSGLGGHALQESRAVKPTVVMQIHFLSTSLFV